MYIQFFLYAVVGTLCFCGIALVIGAWVKREKRMADWAMAIGATMAAFCMLCFGLAMINVDLFREEEIAFVMVGIGTMGVVVFTMGYLMDRFKRRRVLDHQEVMRGIGKQR